ncbi:hypothetical protein F4810DRAFT_699442 [Camillea tinctor]|nr:hypothetical protein F4810DRAFT_699442 [Camillea tinctor]
MLSVASLLNPAPPGPPINRFPPSPALSSPTTSFADDSSFVDRHMIPKHKMPKDAAVFTKSKPKGVVNFLPFERLDPASLRQVRKFQVYPLGKIQEYSRHIPYNSGKKDFYEKTGRESFEVFQYVFRVPGDDTEYTVMWDYNVGLVRMTPFFKCCKYPKTTPAKMLGSNPGLKEITHSITGGSIMAQGYWMPYQCAKAVCATFCHNIAGALIPIFGPDFPSLCTPSEAPEYSRMIIDPAIVIRSTREAEYFRRQYNNHSSTSSNSNMVITSSSSPIGRISPKRDRRLFRSAFDDVGHQPRSRVRKTCVTTTSRLGGGGGGGGGICDSPYATDTDSDISPATTDRSSMSYEHHQRLMHSPIPPPVGPVSLRSSTSWTPVNILPHHSQPHSQYETSGPSPWLTAVPRFTTTAHLQPPPPPPPPPPPAASTPVYPSSRSHSNSQSYSRSQPHHSQYHHYPQQIQQHQHQHQQQQTQTTQTQTWHPNSVSSNSNSKRTASQIDSESSPRAYHHNHHHHPAPAPNPPNRDYHNHQMSTGTAAAGGRGAEEKKSKCHDDHESANKDKNAALMLMKLSVQDGRAREAVAGTESPSERAVPRTKRVRSNSM